MNILRIAIVLAFGLALQIGRVAILDWFYPNGAPDNATWMSVVVLLVLWFTVGNLLDRRLRRWMAGRRPKA